MKRLEKDYVTGDWYLFSFSLNPLVWLAVIGWVVTRPTFLLGLFGGLCFWLGTLV